MSTEGRRPLPPLIGTKAQEVHPQGWPCEWATNGVRQQYNSVQTYSAGCQVIPVPGNGTVVGGDMYYDQFMEVIAHDPAVLERLRAQANDYSSAESGAIPYTLFQPENLGGNG